MFRLAWCRAVPADRVLSAGTSTPRLSPLAHSLYLRSVSLHQASSHSSTHSESDSSSPTGAATVVTSSSSVDQEQLESLCKRRGFVFPGSEIYGGLAGSKDYGPLGVRLKRNLQNLWWRSFVYSRVDVEPIETRIICHPEVWRTTGHLGEFGHEMFETKFGTPSLQTATGQQTPSSPDPDRNDAESSENNNNNNNDNKNKEKKLSKTERQELQRQRALEEQGFGKVLTAYLRPETAQGSIMSFKQVVASMRRQLPFGIAAVGPSFRNEISPGNFLFRSREFEQMEMQFFCPPDSSKDWHHHWVEFCVNWLKMVGLKDESIRLHQHGPEELAHYSLATTDIEFAYPFGWGELWGISNRSDFDLRSHDTRTQKDLRYRDPLKLVPPFYPHIVEPAIGTDRLVYAVLTDALREETFENGTTRLVLRLQPHVAPYRFAILPLLKKAPLVEKAERIFTHLRQACIPCDMDVSGSIGRRYRRQDEIGTPHCITVDFDTLEDDAVTIRCRDSMQQERVSIEEFIARQQPQLGAWPQ